MPELTINVDSWTVNTPDLIMRFLNERAGKHGRTVYDAHITDGKDSVVLVKYSPGPSLVGNLEAYADDILSYIDAGRLDGKPGDDDEYATIEKANKLWGDMYVSPLLADEE